jgi:DNA invertase Pin-like site-specific DNA recombinase
MNAVIYARVSTATQNPQVQVDVCQDYARRQSWRVQAVVAETGSGASYRRQLDQLEEQARRHAFDVLVVAGLDRLGRSTVDVLSRIDRFSRAGCAVVSIREGIDLSSAAGRLQVQLLSAFAEFERELIRERTRAGLARARSQGRTLGRPRAVVDLERCYQLRASGLSWATIGRQVKLSAATVRRACVKNALPSDTVSSAI